MPGARAVPARLALALACALASAGATAASFDCAKARSPVEKQICADPELSRFDELLARFYSAARDRLQENARCLVSDQQQWLRTRNACAGGACLKAAYLARLAELAALQPGMNLPRNLELPAAPALAWAIATPEEMKGDPRVPSKPFRVEGRLAFGEDGYQVRNDAGKGYVLIGDMFLGGATATQLPVILETGKAARFAARGLLRDKEDARGVASFDNHHCVYLHRLN
jgi:uncharacterized protein